VIVKIPTTSKNSINWEDRPMANRIKEFQKLVFAPSIYKTYSKQFNWWFRANPPLIFFVIFYVILTAVVFLNISSFLLYILMTPFLYKALISLYRYTKIEIPVLSRIGKIDLETPFPKFNIVLFVLNLFPSSQISGYEKMSEERLQIHRNQQLAKFAFNLLFVVVIGVFAFEYILLEFIKTIKVSLDKIYFHMEANSGNNPIIEIINALGSLATFGAFIFLFFKDRSKQKQIDELVSIAKTLRDQNANSENRLRITILPEFKKTGTKDNGFPIVTNIGDTAQVLSLELDPPIGNITAFPRPFNVYNKEPLLYDVNALTIPNGFHLSSLVIRFMDKAGNKYVTKITDLQTETKLYVAN
jgi:hypothetical protein